MKGFARGASGDGLHHGRFDFDISPAVEKSPQLANDLRAA